MDVFAAVGANEKAAPVVEPGEDALDDPPLAAEPGAMLSLTARDDRPDAPLPDEPPVLVVVVTAVGDQHPRSTSRAADTATDRRHPVKQLD